MRKRSYTSQKTFGASERADREIGVPMQSGCHGASAAVHKFKRKSTGRIAYAANKKRRGARPCRGGRPVRCGAPRPCCKPKKLPQRLPLCAQPPPLAGEGFGGNLLAMPGVRA